MDEGVGGIDEERCIGESVSITCSDDEFVFFESAFLGRCINKAESEAECIADVRSELQNRFGRNQSVSFSVADPFVYSLRPRCLGNVAPHSITISRRCVNGNFFQFDNFSGLFRS